MTQAIDLAIAEIGTVEWAKGSNPKVVAYYKDAGFAGIKDDDVAWCAAFVGAMLKRAGVKPSNSLLARSYLKWGVQVPISQAKRGDIGVIPRGTDWQGHVFFIEKIEGGKVYAVGGNQKDSVSRTTFPVASLIGVRRAPHVNETPKTEHVAQDVLTPKPVAASPAQNPVAKLIEAIKAAMTAIFKGR